MTAFSAGMVALFDDPNLAEDVVYTPAATGDPITVRAVMSAPDVARDWGESALHVSTVVFDVLVSEVAAPVAGDTIEWRDETRVVQGVPERDIERLTWALDTRPE